MNSVFQLVANDFGYGEWLHRSVKSSKIVNLPNTYNGNYEALRNESLSPESKK